MKIKNLKYFSTLVRFTKISGYFFGLMLLGLMVTTVSAQTQKSPQTQKKTDGIYGPMNWGLDLEDGLEANKLRYDYEIRRILASKEAQIKALAPAMHNCRTSQCRAPIHEKIRQIELTTRKALAAEAELNSKRIELLNKYWEMKPKERLKYFP